MGFIPKKKGIYFRLIKLVKKHKHLWLLNK
jgi:hypothetical protein